MIAFVVWAFLVGIGLSVGSSGTTVILMPDGSGKAGNITVKTQEDSSVLDKAYQFVTIKDKDTRLSEIQIMTEAQVNEKYADLLKAQPVAPSSFILYFFTGTTELTGESQAIIPQVLARIKERAPTEIMVIGHTDSTGTEDGNVILSLNRAKAVEKILKDSIPSLDGVSLNFFGSKDPLVPTPPNIDEPRNRRVEIIIL